MTTADLRPRARRVRPAHRAVANSTDSCTGVPRAYCQMHVLVNVDQEVPETSVTMRLSPAFCDAIVVEFAGSSTQEAVRS